MDEVTQAVENLKKEWSQVVAQLEVCVAAIESCGKMGKGTEEANSLPRLNGSAQDSLQLLNVLQCRLDLLVEQLPTFEEVQSGQATLGSWKEGFQKLRLNLRNANLQAKANIKKAAQVERELLLGGGEESTIRRRNLQTKAGMTSAAESITESLRRSRQLMVQVSTLTCLTDAADANDFLLLSSKVNIVDRKWKEVQIPCQLLVCFPKSVLKWLTCVCIPC
ncbi:hypothetical protein ACQ4PT_025914 [Festuca glaucescens]